MSGWEYKTTRAMSDDEKNALGRDGWELVAAVQRMDNDTYYRTAGASHVELHWKRPAALNPPS